MSARIRKQTDGVSVFLPFDDVHSLRVALCECGCNAPKSKATSAFRKRLDMALARVTAPKPVPRWPELRDERLEQAARDWRDVLDDCDEEMEGFAASIMGLLKRGGTPSDKQAARMKSMHAEWRRFAGTDGEVTE